VAGLAGALKVSQIEPSFRPFDDWDAMVDFIRERAFAMRSDLTDWIFLELDKPEDLPVGVVATLGCCTPARFGCSAVIFAAAIDDEVFAGLIDAGAEDICHLFLLFALVRRFGLRFPSVG